MEKMSKPIFNQNEAQELWASYMKRVSDLCHLLDKRQTADIEMELKAHLLESFVQIKDGDEVSRISAAMERLGKPEDFVPMWVEERLLDGAQPGSSTRNLFLLLRSNAVKGVQQFSFSMLIGLGFLLSFCFFIISILKLFFPQNVGLFLTPSGVPILGYVDAEGFTELLGYWLIPLGLVATFLLQYVLNKLVRKWIGRAGKGGNRHES
jgi:hypothetical protein